MKLTQKDLDAVAFALGIPAEQLPGIAKAAIRYRPQTPRRAYGRMSQPKPQAHK
ncbi:hypothetical protein [Rhodococcus sp. JT-3]|uniref:hypothetical protein n=1 Tax=Rhodococcus sp. JT-3 TaxID=1973213 RepID=UPI0013039ADC|nr:hypothetical protein [Rhodococcus sp. JT-3]